MDRELEELKLTGIEVVTDSNSKERVLGSGSYAAVIELKYHGQRVAGKKFYSFLEERGESVQQIFEECRKLANMRHPCIVQFLGLYWPDTSTLPVLVMECLYTTLDKCIEKHGSLPDEISYTILADVIDALCYLHSKQIAHRDLSSSNILLTSDMHAKISDLGLAKILDTVPKGKLTSKPGTLDFMPPEAFSDNPVYSIKIDIFSFGIIMLSVFCGEYVTPIPKGETERSEVDRRRKYIDKLPVPHPILPCIKKCLDEQQKRPKASQIQEDIHLEKDRLSTHHGDKIMMVKHRQTLEKKVTDLEETQLTIACKSSDLELQVDELKESYRGNHDITTLRAKNNALQEELEKTKQQLKEKEAALVKYDTRDHKQIHTLKQQRNQALAYLTSGKQFHMLHSQVKLKQEKLMETVSSNGQQLTKPVEIKSPMTAAQYTLIKSTLYYGGGETDSEGNKDGRKQIWAFNCEDNTITQVLPPCPVIHFGLGNIEGKLVTVGGRSTEDVSNKVCVYSKNLDGTSEWKEGEIPDLPVARARVCVISQTEDEKSTCIAACGGKVLGQGTGREVSCHLVEVYSKDNPNWITARHLPEARAALRATVLHDTAYLMGGYDDMGEKSKKDCYSISLSNLFGTGKPIVWSQLTILPTQSATPVHLCGTLLAIGGSDENGRPIHAYNVIRREWVHVADLATGLAHAAAATIPNGKALIIGGRDVNGQRNRNIFIVEITGQMF